MDDNLEFDFLDDCVSPCPVCGDTGEVIDTLDPKNWYKPCPVCKPK